MYDTNISYKKKGTDKIYWDKWGKPYRINKGKQVVSLSDIKKKSDSQSSNLCVELVYSTVTDFAKFLGWSTSHPFAFAI